jgi:rSAM/selenodomain-associated transferase 1
VKTRLAATIGAPASCALYRGFVCDLAARLGRIGVPIWWAFTPATAPFARLVGSRRCFAQRGADLGLRIHHALRTVHRASGEPVIALGADMPHVARREIERAGRALAHGADVVLGPAADGGYYLIGVRAPERALFVDVAWGTAGVAAATRRRCRALGLSIVELATGFDVDGARELDALARIVRRRPREFRHTRAALRRLTRPGGSLPPAVSPSSGCARR